MRSKILLTLGRPRDALKHAKEIAEVAQTLSGNEKHYNQALADRLSGAALIELGSYAEALPLLRAAAATLGQLHPDTGESGEALALYGEALVQLGRDDEATSVLQNAVAAYCVPPRQHGHWRSCS